MDASRHIARGIVDRTRGARVVLLDEMMESMEVPRLMRQGKLPGLQWLHILGTEQSLSNAINPSG